MLQTSLSNFMFNLNLIVVFDFSIVFLYVEIFIVHEISKLMLEPSLLHMSFHSSIPSDETKAETILSV